MSDFVELHSLFEADRPELAEYERIARPWRLFPCPGALRRTEEDNRIVRCDVCGFEFATRPTASVNSNDEEMDEW